MGLSLFLYDYNNNKTNNGNIYTVLFLKTYYIMIKSQNALQYFNSRVVHSVSLFTVTSLIFIRDQLQH